MPELRFRFTKEGKAAYLSHLDVMRTFRRAFVRAEIALKHSEGFNPHPKMSIAMPLQLGCESRCELLDAVVLSAPADPLTALNRVLPEGIRVLGVDTPADAAGLIRYADWELRFADPAAAGRAAEILALPSLPVEKKTKRGIGTLDIAPQLRILGKEGAVLRLRLHAFEPSVNTGDVTKALEAVQPGLRPEKAVRLALLKEDETPVR